MPKIFHRPTPGSLIRFCFNECQSSSEGKVVDAVALVTSVRPAQWQKGKYNVEVLVDGAKHEIFCWLGSDGIGQRVCSTYEENLQSSWWLSNRHVRWDVVS